MGTETCLVVRYAETDQMGIAHHSNYPIWFEAGRTDLLKKAGMPNSVIEEKGILLPLSHMECNFINPARYEDEIFVQTKIRNMTCVRIDFQYEVMNQNRKLLTSGAKHHQTKNSNRKVSIHKTAVAMLSRYKLQQEWEKRHTYTTRLFEKGVAPKTVSSLLFSCKFCITDRIVRRLFPDSYLHKFC